MDGNAMIDTIAINHLIHDISHRLKGHDNDHARATQYAWWMLEEIMQCTKSELIRIHNVPLSSKQKMHLDNWIMQQNNNAMPLQYLIGSVPFGDFTLFVESPILIPRPETVQWCIDIIRSLKKLSDQSFCILDIGTGSGCIAIALAQAFEHATIYAVDISQKAIALAKKNAQHNNVHNITFISSDLFTEIKDHRFNMIVSNPPYIAPKEWSMLDKSVREWEDKKALFAHDNGTAILKQIIKKAPDYLTSHPGFSEHKIPQLVLEIGHMQGNSIALEFGKAGFCDNVIHKDMHGNDRVVSGRINDEPYKVT